MSECDKPNIVPQENSGKEIKGKGRPNSGKTIELPSGDNTPQIETTQKTKGTTTVRGGVSGSNSQSNASAQNTPTSSGGGAGGGAGGAGESSSEPQTTCSLKQWKQPETEHGRIKGEEIEPTYRDWDE